MRNFRFTLFVLIVSALVAPSCKKKGSPEGSSCKIVGLTDVLGNITAKISLTYDNQGRAAVQENSGTPPTHKVFFYNGNTELIRSTTGNSTSTDSIILNSDGLAVADYYTTGGQTDETTYTYSGDQVQSFTIQPVTGGAAGTAATYTYTWTNGNLTQSDGGTTASVEGYLYDTTKPAQPGDYWQMLELTSYGYKFVKNTNLNIGTTTTSNGTIYPFEKFTYSFDNAGKITQVVSTYGATTETISYQYSCD